MAIDFDLTLSQYIDFLSPAGLDNIWASGGSTAFWFYIDSLAVEIGLARKATSVANGGDGWSILVTTAGQLQLRHAWSTNRGVWQVSGIVAGTWFHVVIVYDKSGAAPGTDPSIYINGVSQSVTEVQIPSGTVADDNAQSLFLGAGLNQAAARYHDGQIEDFRAYTRPLTAPEIATLAAGDCTPLDGEVVWVKMRELDGIVPWIGRTLAGSDTLQDRSGSGNNGTPTNNPVGRATAPALGKCLRGRSDRHLLGMM
jgi:hypothetical protein